MPAAKKPTVQHKAKLNPKTKPHHARVKTLPRQSKSAVKPTSPAPSTPLPPSTPQPLPMPVVPEHMPGQVYTPLVRTTYNSIWLKRLGLAAGAMAVLGMGYAVWSFRSYLPSFGGLPGEDMAPSITQLSISPTPTLDPTKLSQLSSDLAAQSTDSATESLTVDQASSSAQLLQDLEGQTTLSLKQELDRYIVDLNRQQVNTNNLEAYQSKIHALEASGENEQARKWLIEAVMHARELDALHGYYNH